MTRNNETRAAVTRNNGTRAAVTRNNGTRAAVTRDGTCRRDPLQGTRPWLAHVEAAAAGRAADAAGLAWWGGAGTRPGC